VSPTDPPDQEDTEAVGPAGVDEPAGRGRPAPTVDTADSTDEESPPDQEAQDSEPAEGADDSGSLADHGGDGLEDEDETGAVDPGEDRDDPPDALDPSGRPPIDPRIRQRRVAIKRSQGRKRLLWLGGATGILVVVVLAFGLAHTPWFGAQAITVTGTHPRTTDAAIVNAAGLQNHPPLINVNPGAVARRVESLPFIASAQVHRHWPDGVQIAVTERAPVVQMAGPGTAWSLLDGHGRTLQEVPGRVPGLVVYIVHTPDSGIPPAPVGSALPPSAGPGLEVSRTLPRAFADQVVSVTVAADGSISLALDSGVTVLFGSDADRTAKYKDIAAILANGTLHATSVIDVTVPESPTVSG
jgi:cell division protein FtsQ